jgi:uncharacterized protein YbaR (Trm112 family)
MADASGRLDPRLLEVLACPKDKGPLVYLADEDTLYNPRLKLRYRVTDGIPVMLIDEAEEVGEDEHARILAKASSESPGGPGAHPEEETP